MSTANLVRSNWRRTSFADLQSAAADGQAWALEALAAEFLPRLVSFATSRGAADPDGIAHVSLLAVLPKLRSTSSDTPLHFEAKEQMWAYLCQTARRRIIDEFRTTKPVVLIDDERGLNNAASQTSTSTMSFEDLIAEQDYVDELLSPLTVEQRQVMEMRFLHDLSVEETANRTGRSPNAVKGLQRRAINAIIAAAAVLILLVVLRMTSDGQATQQISNDPATTDVVTDNVEPVPNEELGIDAPDGNQNRLADDPTTDDRTSTTATDGTVASDAATENSEPTTVQERQIETNGSTVQDEPSNTVTPNTVIPNTATPNKVTPNSASPNSDGDDLSAPDNQSGTATSDANPRRSNGVRFDVTQGSGQATGLDLSGATVPEQNHGARIYCVVSHYSYGSPLTATDAAADVATMYWGNTEADANSSGATIAASGNGSCEGGTSDRSAYWAPALFDQAGQVVLPETVVTEYKSFGHPGFDRSTVQPIPAGLEAIASSIQTSPARNGLSTMVRIAFPECIQTNQAGEPVLSSPNGSHLAEPDASPINGCPRSHPYRIPRLNHTIQFAVAYQSGWSLSTGLDADSPAGRSGSGFISGMNATTAADVAQCIIDLVGQCQFTDFVDNQPLTRAQLPERFTSPEGNAIYNGSTALAAEADRTPFGDSLTPSS